MRSWNHPAHGSLKLWCGQDEAQAPAIRTPIGAPRFPMTPRFVRTRRATNCRAKGLQQGDKRNVVRRRGDNSASHQFRICVRPQLRLQGGACHSLIRIHETYRLEAFNCRIVGTENRLIRHAQGTRRDAYPQHNYSIARVVTYKPFTLPGRLLPTRWVRPLMR
jgi:hypothetical protein